MILMWRLKKDGINFAYWSDFCRAGRTRWGKLFVGQSLEVMKSSSIDLTRPSWRSSAMASPKASSDPYIDWCSVKVSVAKFDSFYYCHFGGFFTAFVCISCSSQCYNWHAALVGEGFQHNLGNFAVTHSHLTVFALPWNWT